mmetsp:Transcript_7911/g.12028  ORF Transcript_7911/g.12028 Transcript_7911/m.12028 type:complete len:235 (-) Transcript_7911:23-727(-)
MANKVALVLRLENNEGKELMALNLQQTKSKLGMPLRESIERFCRYYNRRNDGNSLDARQLQAYIDSRSLDPNESLEKVMEINTRLDVILRFVETSEQKDQENEEKHDENQTNEEYEQLDITDLPPPNDFIADKANFDRVLHGIPANMILIVFFQMCGVLEPTSESLAPAYRRMAHHFWPRVIMLRADIHGDIAKACNAVLAPTVVFFKEHKAVDILVAGTDMQINVKISRLLKT